MTAEDLKTEGVSLKGKVAKEGLALARLSEPIFQDVIDGSLTPARGAVIGEGVPNHADQQALYKLIQARERGGKRLTNDQIEELIRLNDRTATKTESSDAGGQGGLFGEEEMTRSLLPEKAEVSDYVRKELGAEKKLFGAVSSQAAAERLGETGNVIKAGENAATAERANQGSVLYDKLSTKAGPIDGVLDRAAQRLANGENANDAKQQAYREIRDYLTAQIRQLSGVPQGDGGRAEGLGKAGPREAGAGQHHQRAVAAPAVDPQAELRAQVEKARAENAALKAKKAGRPDASFNIPGKEPSAGKSRVPAISGDRTEPYITGAPIRFHIKRMRFERFRLEPADAARAQAYVTNPDGMAYLVMLSGHPGDEGGMQYRGVHLTPKSAASLADIAKGFTRAYTDEGPQGLLDIIQAAASAARLGKSLIVISDHADFPDWQKETALDEELGHSLQFHVTGKQPKHHLGNSAGWLASGTEAGKRAAASIEGRYGKLPEGELASEIAVRLLRPEGYKKLGISSTEARTLAAQYVRALRNEYGPRRTTEIAQRVFDTARTGYPRQSAGESRPGRTAISGGPGQDLRASPAGERDSEKQGRPPDPRDEGPSGYQPNRVGSGNSPSGPGLFDTADEQQSREDAEHNQAKLLHDQLTAQIKSGLPAKPAKLKPTQNRGLFDEEQPEQGGLFYKPPNESEDLHDTRRDRGREDQTEIQRRIGADPASEDLRRLQQGRREGTQKTTPPERKPGTGGTPEGGQNSRVAGESEDLRAELARLLAENAALKAESHPPAPSPPRQPQESVTLGSGLGALEPFFRESVEEGNALRAKREAAVQAMKARAGTPGEQRLGEATRQWFTGMRDLWSTKVNQAIDRSSRVYAPDVVTREAIGMMREFVYRPWELQQFLDGIHPDLVGQNPKTLARVEALRPAMRLALNPTAKMLKANETYTRIADRSLQVGQAGGWLASRWKPEEYMPHLLHQEGEGEVAAPPSDDLRMMGNVGKHFQFAARRSDPYPTMLHAVANGLMPKTMDPAVAFSIHGSNFARAMATHTLEEALGQNTNLGHWGTADTAPDGWVPLAKHSDEFTRAGGERLYVPEWIEQSMAPITAPEFTNKYIRGIRGFQRGLKEAILGLSGFHLITENYMAASDIGLKGIVKSLRTPRDSEWFERWENNGAAHGMQTSIAGHTMGAYRSLGPGSIPTRGEIIRAYLPGAKMTLQVADAITRLTFDNMQRRYKVTSYALHAMAWDNQNPLATAEQQSAARQGVASYVNGVYGGLHWENMGWRRGLVEERLGPPGIGAENYGLLGDSALCSPSPGESGFVPSSGRDGIFAQT